jgi:para-nitrobenzyl esterase
MDLEPFGEKYKNSANAGHADMVAALEWVRDNIQNFGGDPGNVTIFGQSGGGIKCTGLMQIPSANGLFHKAIILSGVSDGTLLPAPKGDGRRIVEALLAELALSEVERLETVPYYELNRAYNKVSPLIAKDGGYIGNGPMANDYYMGEPLISGFTEHAKTIPFIVGSVFGEFTFGPLPVEKEKASDGEINAALRKHFGPRYTELLDLYKKADPCKHPADLFALDKIFRIPSKKLAMLAAEESKAPAYLYNFTLEFPYRQNKIAWHCADIPFFFHNTDKVEVCNIQDVSDKLEEQMFNAVIAFARDSDPNHPAIPHWPAVKPHNEYTMIFDRQCEARRNYDNELMELLHEISPSLFTP